MGTTKPNSAPPPTDPVLQRYAAQFQALRAQLADLGVFCKGGALDLDELRPDDPFR